jgi:hypothetical protein
LATPEVANYLLRLPAWAQLLKILGSISNESRSRTDSGDQLALQAEGVDEKLGPRLYKLWGETQAIGLFKYGGHLERPGDVTLPDARDTNTAIFSVAEDRLNEGLPEGFSAVIVPRKMTVALFAASCTVGSSQLHP